MQMVDEIQTFFNRFVVNIKTSVSWVNDWMAPRYPTLLRWVFGDDITSTTWKEAQLMSYPSMSS